MGQDGPVIPNTGPEAAGDSALNLVLLIQVPLKQKQPMMQDGMVLLEGDVAGEAPSEAKESNIEAAVIGHGPVEGPFAEIDGLKIERDERFPIRVTVQFYKATSNGVVSAADMADINAQLKQVYENADYVGSLVVDGPSRRPTEYDGAKQEPAGWWSAFWQRFEDNTGLTRQQAGELWRSLRFRAR